MVTERGKEDAFWIDNKGIDDSGNCAVMRLRSVILELGTNEKN